MKGSNNDIVRHIMHSFLSTECLLSFCCVLIFTCIGNSVNTMTIIVNVGSKCSSRHNTVQLVFFTKTHGVSKSLLLNWQGQRQCSRVHVCLDLFSHNCYVLFSHNCVLSFIRCTILGLAEYKLVKCRCKSR